MRDYGIYFVSLSRESGDGIDRRRAKLVELVDLAEQDSISTRYFKHGELDDMKLCEGLDKMAGFDGEIDADQCQRDLIGFLHMDSKQSTHDNASIGKAAALVYIRKKGLRRKLIRNGKWEQGLGQVIETLMLQGVLPELRVKVRQQLGERGSKRDLARYRKTSRTRNNGGHPPTLEENRRGRTSGAMKVKS